MPALDTFLLVVLAGAVLWTVAHAHPRDVVGLVLIDVSDEQGAGSGLLARVAVVQQCVYGVLGRVGVVRLFGGRLLAAEPAPPPTVVHDRVVAAHHARLAALSSASVRVTADSDAHYVPYAQPVADR